MADSWDEKTGEDAAIEYCKKEIKFYGDMFEHNHARWKWWQRTAIVAGVIGTILVTIQLPINPAWGIIRAIPVGLASIATGIMGSFSYQADAVRQGATSDSLQGELAKYLARASPYDSKQDGERISLFMNSIRIIISNEQGSWQSQTKPPGLPLHTTAHPSNSALRPPTP